MDASDKALYLLQGSYAKAAALYAVDEAAGRGVGAELLATWRATIEQADADWDLEGIKAVGEYAARYTPEGPFTEPTLGDTVVETGLDVATATRDLSAMLVGGFALVVVLLLVTRR